MTLQLCSPLFSPFGCSDTAQISHCCTFQKKTSEAELCQPFFLEATANAFPGVEKSYALQAGREIRVFVTPEQISDLEAKKMARDIADKIESDLKYPGEIKVTLIRENRIIEYAR